MGVSKWSFLVLVLAIVLVVILGQNTERVDVDVLWATFQVPLFLVVLLAALGLPSGKSARWRCAIAVVGLGGHRARATRAGVPVWS